MGSSSPQPELRSREATEPETVAPKLDDKTIPAAQMARLEDIYKQYYRFIFRFFLVRNCTHEECKDLVQETFLRVCTGLEGFREDASLATWLTAVAESTFKNFVRARKTQKRSGVEIPIDDAAKAGLFNPANRASTRSDGPFRKLLHKERRDKLQLALNELPPRRRMCVLLRLTKDLKYRQIADLMQISIQTVKSHLSKAKEELKAKLGEDVDNDWDDS
ncbi:MAG TPA: RNA polymerase sigma factor [Acidobacteriota bacterium]|nr:RNA polymerase sigma factor [Acidobacteriota bacterium]